MGDGRMHIRQFLTAIFCGAIFASAISFEEPLDPAVAFQPTVSAGGGAVVVNYRIAEDYYLYRGRFQFSADGAILDDAAFPPGEAKEDDFFGKVEIYRDFVSIAVPAKMDGGTESFAFSAVSQGCAEKLEFAIRRKNSRRLCPTPPLAIRHQTAAAEFQLTKLPAPRKFWRGEIYF